MKNEDDIFNEFQRSLETLKGNLHVLETNVPVEKQMEYFRYSDDVRAKMQDKSIESQIDALNAEGTPQEDKKFAMTFLAISGDVKAYRALEHYTQDHANEPTDLGDWLKLSLLQARITLESELSEEKHIFISSGLGGKEDKLRFFSIFRSNDLLPFSPYQIHLIEKEIPFFIGEYHGEVENITIKENYFTIVFLIQLKVNIKEVLEKALNECNQYGDFISRKFIVTNVKIYSDKEIQEELQKH